MILILLLGIALYFSLVTLLADYDTNKQSNIVDHINWFYQSCQLECTKR